MTNDHSNLENNAFEEPSEKMSEQVVLPRSHSRARRLVALLVVAGSVITAVTIALTRNTSAEVPEAKPDVPHVDGSAIVFSKSFRERSGVVATLAKRQSLAPVVRVVGDVTFDPQYVAAVGTRIRGLVTKLERLEGDSVHEGDLLAEIESAELGEAQASVTMIDAQRKSSEKNAERERDLSARKLSTAREAEVAETLLTEHNAMLGAARQKVLALGGSSTAPLGIYRLRAPLTGTVVSRGIAAGQSVEGPVVAYRVADLAHLWIELSVFEKNLTAIHPGDQVLVEPLSEPGNVIQGTVAYVGDEIDPMTRSADVRVKLDNSARKLRPGQSVTARIRTSAPARDALVVPVSAVTFVDGKPTVFVAESDERMVPTKVELGATDGVLQEILSGVGEGTSVVHEGVFALKSELFR